MQSNLKTLVQKLIPSLEFLYLFGSVASGQDNEGSDIDIAFVSSKEVTNLERWGVQQRLSLALGGQVDFIDMTKASDIMNMQIVAKGRLIYARHPEKVDSFENNVYYKYIDLRELNKEIYDDIAKRGKVYG